MAFSNQFGQKKAGQESDEVVVHNTPTENRTEREREREREKFASRPVRAEHVHEEKKHPCY